MRWSSRDAARRPRRRRRGRAGAAAARPRRAAAGTAPTASSKSARARSSWVTTTARGMPTDAHSDHSAAVAASRPCAADTTNSTASAARSPARSSPTKSGPPGVSSRVDLEPSCSSDAAASDTERPSRCSTSSASQTVRAVLHVPGPRHHPRRVQQGLDQGRLAGPGRADEGDAAQLRRRPGVRRRRGAVAGVRTGAPDVEGVPSLPVGTGRRRAPPAIVAPSRLPRASPRRDGPRCSTCACDRRSAPSSTRWRPGCCGRASGPTPSPSPVPSACRRRLGAAARAGLLLLGHRRRHPLRAHRPARRRDGARAGAPHRPARPVRRLAGQHLRPARRHGRLRGAAVWGLGDGDDVVVGLLALLCLGERGALSYAKARAEGLGLRCDVGLAERAGAAHPRAGRDAAGRPRRRGRAAGRPRGCWPPRPR